MEVKVLKPANVKYVKEGHTIDLPDHIAKAGIEKGIFEEVGKKSTAKKSTKKATKK